jgi:hypothetical protein
VLSSAAKAAGRNQNQLQAHDSYRVKNAVAGALAFLAKTRTAAVMRHAFAHMHPAHEDPARHRAAKRNALRKDSCQKACIRWRSAGTGGA